MPKVLVSFIQDRSGSMGHQSGLWQETLNGFKQFVEARKAETDVEYLFSLTCFDTVIDLPIEAQRIASVDGDILKEYPPRGGTALYDAAGMTIVNIAELLKNKTIEVDKIICVIVTDGHENSSREWTKDALNQLISEKLDSGIWTFTYLGTQPETWDESSAIGFAVGATAVYDNTQTGATYAAMGSAVHALSASPDTQSRALFTSAHANPKAMRAAGMKLRPQSPSQNPRDQKLHPTSRPPVVAKAKKPKKPIKPWR